MRTKFIITGMMACLCPYVAMATTLQQAMDIASDKHPQLHMAEQSLEAARADLIEQGSYAYNPEMSLEPQRRKRNSGGTSNDYYITLSQGVELGGKQGYRQQSAQANVDAVGQRVKAMHLRLQTEAARAFVSLYYAQQILLLRQQQRDVLHQVSQAVKQQLVIGESSQLDANLASSTYISALNAAVVAQQALTQARRTYALALGQSPSQSELVLPQLSTDWKVPSDASEAALASSPDLASMRAQLLASNAQAELAGAQQVPDITISAMSGREAGDQLVKLGVSVPFPVFNNHKGAYRAALAREDQVKTELAWAEQQLRMSVKAALINHHEAMQALAGMTGADKTARSTLTLAHQAYDAGELDLEELVVHIRQSLGARLTVVETMQQAWLAHIRLAEVLGHPEYISQGSK